MISFKDSLPGQKSLDTFNTQGIPIDTLGTIKPISPIQEFNFSSLEWTFMILLGIGLAVLGWLIFKRAQKKKEIQVPKNLPKDPYGWATDKIHEIQNKTHEKKLNLQEYFVQVSSIIREFIVLVSEVDAPRNTTTRVIYEFTKIQTFGPEKQKMLIELLKIADKVKFSGSLPNAQLVEEYGRVALDFVKKSNPGK